MRIPYRRALQRTSATLVIATLLFMIPGLSLQVAKAITNVATGTVTTSTDLPMADVTIELHTPDGLFSKSTLTDASGNYSFSEDLTVGTNYVVEPRTPTGYNRVNSGAIINNFVYDGTAHPGINFQFVATSKTITGRVTSTKGEAIGDADIELTPYNNPSASSTGGPVNADGTFSFTVVGGAWFIQPVINLSAYTQRWISEVPPQRIDFTSDTTAETSTTNFEVTPASGKVTVKLLNSDGSKLTTSDFVADIDFRRADGVGTKRKVQQSDSSVSVFLTPGIYTITAFHNDLRGKSFDPTQTTFVMTEGGDIDLGTVQASVDSAHLKGKVLNSKNQAFSNVQIQAIRDGGAERPTANSGPDGSFDLTVGAGTWTIGLSSNDNFHTLVSPVSATVTNGQTASGLNIQVKDLDRTITGSVFTSSGTKVTDFVGSAYVRTSNNAARVSAPVVAGDFTIKYSSADIAGSKVITGIQAAPGAAYAGGAEKQVTLQGMNGTVSLKLKAYDATLTGTLKLPNGTAVTSSGSDIQIVAVDSEGNFTNTTVATDGTYSLPLAAGTWLYDYDIQNPELTDGLLNRDAGQNALTVAANAKVSRNLTVLQGTNIITGTVKDAAGTVVQRVKVVADNRTALETNGSANPNDIVTVSTETNELGVYTMKVPNGTYMITVGETPSVPDTQLAPDGKSVKVSGGSTTTTNLVFKTANATIKGKIILNGKAEGGGTVTAYSTDGAQATAAVDKNGNYTLPVSGGEKWTLVATDLGGKRLVTSEAIELTPKAGTTTTNLTVKDSGVNVPGPVTKTAEADDGLSVSLPDGTNVSLPPFALGISGTVSVTVTPTIDIDPTTMDRPASLAYEVKAIDGDGQEKKNLDRPATVTIPYTETVVVNSGLREKGLATKYFNPQTETWETAGAAGLVDTKKNVATLTTTHLTKFAVAGTSRAKPTVSKFAMKSRTSKTMVMAVTGTNFKGKVTLTVGTVKATKVQVQNTKSLLVTVPTTSLKNGSYNVNVTNGDGRQVIKKMTYSKGRVLGASVVKLIPR